jgi:hypothetical protein
MIRREVNEFNEFIDVFQPCGCLDTVQIDYGRSRGRTYASGPWRGDMCPKRRLQKPTDSSRAPQQRRIPPDDDEAEKGYPQKTIVGHTTNHLA